MPQQQELNQLQLDFKGLYTNPNDLSKVPLGALLEASNIVIDRDGIGEQRRGMKAYGTSISFGGDVIDSGAVYQDRMIWHYGDTFIQDSDGLGTWTPYSGSFDIPTGAFAVRSVQANKNIYFTTDSGIQKLDAIAGTIRPAGTPQGLDGSGTTTGASGWFPDQTQVAYRVVWGYVDANNNTILGAPSERIIVANNSGGTRNVSLTFTIPDDITTSYFYQIYRSPTSVDLATQPNDELQLVLQLNPTGGQIAAQSVTLTDSVPDELKGATIYTAASQQGIGQANYTPPIAADFTAFKNFTFYANTIGKQFIDLTLLSVGAPNGLVLNDTITISGLTYTAKAAENAAAAEFLLFTTGTPSENIDTTARSLVHVINTYASNTTVYAYYVSGFNDLPGQIVLQERGIGGGSFTLSVSRASAWYFTTSTSTNDTFPARVYVSKFQQPEAVPLLNSLDIGSADKPILRILALRDSIFVFKTDGVFRITGDDLTTFAVAPWDNTVTLRAPEAAVLLNNQIYCFSTQAVIAVSETGTSIVSRPIETDLLTLSASQYATFDSVTFAVSYESDRKYILNTISSIPDTSSTQAFTNNYITNAWTQWVFPRNVTAGLVNPTDNKLYMASSDASFPFIYQERKSFTETDFADDEFAVSITASSGTTVNVNSTTGILAGYTLTQGFIRSTIVTVVNATTLIVTDSLTWGVAAAIIYKPIDVSLEWAPIHGGNPTVTKLFQEVIFFFSKPDFEDMQISFTSNFSPAADTFDIVPGFLGAGWGVDPWGFGPWGGGAGELQPLRTWVPIEKCRAHWLGIRLQKSQALTTFALNGITVGAKSMSFRFK